MARWRGSSPQQAARRAQVSSACFRTPIVTGNSGRASSRPILPGFAENRDASYAARSGGGLGRARREQWQMKSSSPDLTISSAIRCSSAASARDLRRRSTTASMTAMTNGPASSTSAAAPASAASSSLSVDLTGAAFQLDRLFVEVYEESAEDGSEINKVIVPVIYGPRIVPGYLGFRLHTVKVGDTLSKISKEEARQCQPRQPHRSRQPADHHRPQQDLRRPGAEDPDRSLSFTPSPATLSANAVAKANSSSRSKRPAAPP